MERLRGNVAGMPDGRVEALARKHEIMALGEEATGAPKAKRTVRKTVAEA